MRFVAVVAAAICLLSSSPQTTAQQSAAIEAKAALETARKLSSLHQDGTPSYRLQANFETYDYKGVPNGKGVFTEIFLRQEFWQRSTLYREKHSQVTSVQGKVRTVSDPDFESSFAMLNVVDALFEPIPDGEGLKAYTLALRTIKTSATPLDCVTGALPYKAAGVYPVVNFGSAGLLTARREVAEENTTAVNKAFCMGREPSILRLIQSHHGTNVTFNRIIRFGALYVPGDITIMEDGKLRAHLSVNGIVAVPNMEDKEIVLPPADVGVAKVLQGAVTAGKTLKKVPPVYPEQAKERRIQGTVLVRAFISKEGRVRDLDLISSPDDSLVDAAMDAVRQWIYLPYLVDGKPVEVDSQITINFAFR